MKSTIFLQRPIDEICWFFSWDNWQNLQFFFLRPIRDFLQWMIDKTHGFYQWPTAEINNLFSMTNWWNLEFIILHRQNSWFFSFLQQIDVICDFFFLNWWRKFAKLNFFSATDWRNPRFFHVSNWWNSWVFSTSDCWNSQIFPIIDWQIFGFFPWLIDENCRFDLW